MTNIEEERARFSSINRRAADSFRSISQEPEFKLEGRIRGTADSFSPNVYDFVLRNNTGSGEPWSKTVHTASDAVYGFVHMEYAFQLSSTDIVAALRNAREAIKAAGYDEKSRIGNVFMGEFGGRSIPFAKQQGFSEKRD